VRNGLYGLELRRILDVHGWRNAAAAHLTIDESTAVAVTQGDSRASRLGFWVTGLGVFALWNLATLLGAIVGNALGDPRTYGLDAAACAAFTALLWPRLRDRETVAIAAVGAVIAVALLPALPAGIPVVLAALAALIAGRRR
jgi:predicted branched-subunit amino acid permease